MAIVPIYSTREKMKTKLIIFDLDGTLLDTIDDIAAACNHALKQCGFPERERDEYFMLVGRGITNLFRGALPEGMKTEYEVERMREHFLSYYNAHSCDLTKPYAGIVEMLTALSSQGVRFAIASKSGTSFLRRIQVRVYSRPEGRKAYQTGPTDCPRSDGSGAGDHKRGGRILRRQRCRHDDRKQCGSQDNRRHLGFQKQGGTFRAQSLDFGRQTGRNN